ncbi:hypothetical protein MRX96_049439 [Rhipicephalus microplus]
MRLVSFLFQPATASLVFMKSQLAGDSPVDLTVKATTADLYLYKTSMSMDELLDKEFLKNVVTGHGKRRTRLPEYRYLNIKAVTMVKTACLILVALAAGCHVTSGQQLPFWDANSYVDQMLLSRLPAHREDIDPLVEPAFALHNSHDKRYGPVRFEDSNVTGLSRVSRVQRGDQCASVTDEFPDSANVTVSRHF